MIANTDPVFGFFFQLFGAIDNFFDTAPPWIPNAFGGGTELLAAAGLAVVIALAAVIAHAVLTARAVPAKALGVRNTVPLVGVALLTD